MEQGDHLYYYRGGVAYSHHGIYCGDGTVVHYESSLWMKFAGTLREKVVPRIARVSLETFGLGCTPRVRSYSSADMPEVVMERALSRVGEADYHLLDNNCEHFAVWCKTGQRCSTQVDAHRHARRAVVKGSPAGLFLLRSVRHVPAPYRGWAFAGALALAGGTYATQYLACRFRDMRDGRS